jgi:hypothetical protein
VRFINQTGAKRTDTDQGRGSIMKKFSIAGIIAGGLTAAVLGLAAPASADISHHDWIYDIQPHATAPQVDNTVHQSH